MSGFRKRTVRRGGASGFTVLELMLSLVILGMLLGLVIPNMYWAMESAQLDSCADRVTAGLRLARLEAMRRGVPVRVRYDEKGHRFVVETVSSTFDREEPSGPSRTKDAEGFFEIRSSWVSQLVLPERVGIHSIVADPPDADSLQLYLAGVAAGAEIELADVGITEQTLGQQIFAEEPAKLSDDRFAYIRFEADGSVRGGRSLRIVLAYRSAIGDGGRSGGGAGLSGAEPKPLGAGEEQVWVTVHPWTGRALLHRPSRALVELTQEVGEQRSGAAWSNW